MLRLLGDDAERGRMGDQSRRTAASHTIERAQVPGVSPGPGLASGRNNTLLLTGLPRSGTTLVCALLNRTPDVVALAEPMRWPKVDSREAAVDAVTSFVRSAHRMIQEQGVAPTKGEQGWETDNFLGPPEADGSRFEHSRTVHLRPIPKPLSPDYLLCIKHPAFFTALAPELSQDFPVFATIRSPLAILASWQTITYAPARGRILVAERLEPGLGERLSAIEDLVDRQVELVSWFLSMFERLPERHVIRYEDVLLDPASQLSRLVGSRSVDAVASHPIHEQAPEDRYPSVDFTELAKKLRRIQPQIERFYPGYGRILDDAAAGRRAVHG